MTQPETYGAFMAAAPTPSPAPVATTTGNAKTYTLPRRGKRPLTFTGSELCMAMNYAADCHSWYEVNIYRTTDKRFVLCLRQFFRDENEQDTVKAWECETFGEVMDRLESYDAADDVRVTVFADDPKLSVPEMAAHALNLRAKAEAARMHFGGLVGEILAELEADA